MVFVRSLAFNVYFYLNTTIWLIGLLPTLALPRSVLVAAVRVWSRLNRRMLGLLAGVRVEFRGVENVPAGGALIVSKHQSTFETVATIDLFSDPAFVLKKELLSIPLFGWYARKAEEIPVDRRAGRSALLKMTARARREVERGRQIVIYPEGTRRPAGAEPAYKHGVINLYRDLGVPMVPVALNSGLFWPRHGFRRRPGTLIVQFLPPIAPGGEPEASFRLVQSEIETTTDALIAEALDGPNPPPLPPGGEAWFARRKAR